VRGCIERQCKNRALIDRDKLIKCLRMFSSSFDGEVTSAARRAHELIASRKLDWDDLIVKPGRQYDEEPPRQPHHWNWNNGPISDIRRCQELGDHLNGWEAEFVASIAASIVEWGRLTEKQQACLDRIVNKLKLAGLWEGEAGRAHPDYYS
jgi:hypothetical protein